MSALSTRIANLIPEQRRALEQRLMSAVAAVMRPSLDGNETGVSYPEHRCLHEMVERQVGQSPDAVAVVFEQERITYRELNDRANQLAYFLRASGVGPEVVVGICVERSIEMVVGLLGILKAGGAYLPIDPSYPLERISFMARDGRIRLLLTQRELAERLDLDGEMRGLDVFPLDAGWEQVAAFPTTNLPNQVCPDSLAYVIYTSGSTGLPKGSMLHHRGICNRLVWMQHAYQLGAADAVLQKTSFSFDVSVWEFFWPLMTGARLVLARPGGHRDGAYLVEVIRRERITVLHFVPSMLQAWLPERGVEECRSLRLLVCSGEALGAGLRRRVEERMGWVELENLYGPTEASVDVTRWSCRLGGEVEEVPIGRPIWNTQMYVLGRELELLPTGVTGELYIGGVQLARGYAGRPELTAERFIPHPYSTRGGERLYQTGDLGRYSKDGEIDYLGRVDEQVKIRGYRIELGEVEAALSAVEWVRECVVAAREDEAGHKRLVAYVVSENEAPATTASTPAALVSELRERLLKSLPEYMVPSSIIFLERLPLTANGKIDRRSLPAPDSSGVSRRPGYAPPRTEAEATLARIWGEVLGLERVGVRDNFFDLGGDSILSIQIVSRASAAGLRVTAKELFRHQTVEGLARAVGRGEAGEEGGGGAGQAWVEQGEVTGPVALTPIQRRFFSQGRARPEHFNQSVMLRVRADVGAGELRGAVRALLAHHDALRLRFLCDAGGEWQQSNAGLDEGFAAGDVLHEVELGAVGEPERRAALEQAAGQAQRSLSLAGGPLLRALLIRLGAGEEPRLLIVIHHLAVDGVSWRILLEDLQAAYRQLRGGRRVELPPKTSSYQQWAARLTEYAAGERVEEEARYWREQPWGRAARLPRDREGGQNRRGDARQAVVALSREETRRLLQEAPAAYRTRIQELLLAALARVLCEWAGGEWVAVEVEGHGREVWAGGAELTRTVGWFTSVYPVLLGGARGGGYGELIKGVKEQLRGVPEGGMAYGVWRYLRGGGGRAGAGAEGGEMPAESGAESGAGAGAEVVFNYLGQLDQVLTGGVERDAEGGEQLIVGAAGEWGGEGEDAEAERGWAHEINGAVAGGRLELRWGYSGQQYEAGTMERVAGRYREELVALIEHCREEGAGGRTPSDFPLARLTQAEVDRLAGDGRRVEDIYPVTPMQQGLLFHALYAPAAGFYHQQVSCELGGGFDAGAFVGAWGEVMGRHAILRTGFVWEGVGEPLQVVYRGVELPVEEYDWRGLGAGEQAERWVRVVAQDRGRGFEPGRAPLMRLALARVGEQEYRLLWSHHHLLLDGWCLALVNQEVFAAYDRRRGVAGAEGVAEESAGSRPYRDYIAWLQRQDMGRAEQYWRHTLQGFDRPTPLPLGRPPAADDGEPYGDRMLGLTPEQVRLLVERARREQVTMNTVLQGAWALLLARYSNTPDVVFGATVSGRPAELEGVERMVGLFINTLPVRVRVSGGQGVWGWLRELQTQQVEMRQYEYSPLAQVQGWSEVGAGRALFDTLLVYENYPVERDGAGPGSGAGTGVRIRKASKAVRTKYPLTLVGGMGGERLVVYVSYERRRFGEEAVAGLAAVLEGLLVRMSEGGEWDACDAAAGGEHERRAREEYEEWEREAKEGRTAEGVAVAEGGDRPVLELVREAVCAVLGLEAVGSEENFFELGGHSLLGTQLVSRVRELFGVELPLRAVFEVGTVGELARAVEGALREAAGVAAPPILRAERGAESAVSFAQRRLWLLEQLEPGSALYNIPMALRLSGELKKEALGRTLTEIVRRHEVLRTTFKAVNGEPVQVISEAAPVTLPEADVSGLEGAEQEAAVQRLAQEEAAAPFDLGRGPLLRLKLLRLGESEHVVLLTMHHIVSDGWSMGVFVDEVATLYRAYSEGEESPLPELEVQYADFAIRQREWLQGEALERQLSYWEEKLRGAAILELPTDRPRPAVPTHRGARQSFELSAELSQGLKELSRREGATLFMTLLAGFQALLARHTGQTDVVVGTVVAGRTRREVEPLVGPFTNTLALRTNLSGDPTFRELLQRVREVCLGAYVHQELPFERLVEELQPERDLGVSPLFRVTFGVQNAPAGGQQVPGLELRPVEVEVERSRFELTVWASERGGRLQVEMTYNTELFEEGSVVRLRRRYETLLGSIVNEAGARLSALEFIPQEEKEEQASRKKKRQESHVEKLKAVRRKGIS
jgi:amino acid adenylation domain-containing protein/non-ribosomal peptide synthase protein (TIGR01720 family)